MESGKIMAVLQCQAYQALASPLDMGLSLKRAAWPSGLRGCAFSVCVDVAQVKTMNKGFQLFHIFYKFPKLSGQISGFSKV